MSTRCARLTAVLATAVVTAVLAPAASADDSGLARRHALPPAFGKPLPKKWAPPRPRSGHRPRRPVARKSAFPYHQLDTQYCRYGQISINTPRQVVSNTGGYEYVYFKTDVYRLTSSGWSLYTGTPYARAIAGPNGLAGGSLYTSQWSWLRNGSFSDNFPGAYNISLPPGTYVTLQMIWWGSLTYPTAEQPPFYVNSFTGVRYCSF
jgi:hypothetical protein